MGAYFALTTIKKIKSLECARRFYGKNISPACDNCASNSPTEARSPDLHNV